MNDLEEFEGRIVAALDRVSRLIDGAGSIGTAPAAAVEELEDQLAEAREDNENLRAWVARAEDRKAQAEARTDKRLARLASQVEAANQQVGRARQTNIELRTALDQLRAGIGAGDASVAELRRSYEAELAGLRKARDDEAAELDRILAELRPLIAAEED